MRDAHQAEHDATRAQDGWDAILWSALFFILGFATACVLTAYALSSKALAETPWEAQALGSVVRINTGDGVGSGVVVAATKSGYAYKVLVVTNNHVICGEGAVEKCNPHPWVEWFGGLNGRLRLSGTLLRHDKSKDLALVSVLMDAGQYKSPSAATMSAHVLAVFDPVLAIGSGLGFEPFPTKGMISIPLFVHGSMNFILHSAEIIFGNSGGGLFYYNAQKHRYELVGINDAIAGTGPGGQAVPHMAMAIPLSVVTEFLGAKT